MLDDPFLQRRELNRSPKNDSFLGAVFGVSAFAKKTQAKNKKRAFPKNKTGQFEARLEEVLEPSFSAKELIEKIVRTALEVEFGPSFTMAPGFARMVSTIAETIVTNPELRRQALAVASIYISRKLGPREQIKQ
jgi:hypothetical protein